MYAVTVEANFQAFHRLRLPDGTLEPRHAHDWRVRARFVQAELDDAGMVVDFGKAQSALESVAKHLDGTDLNDHAHLAVANPTAELVAKHIFERLAGLGLSALRRVEVMEAPGCTATFEPTP